MGFSIRFFRPFVTKIGFGSGVLLKATHPQKISGSDLHKSKSMRASSPTTRTLWMEQSQIKYVQIKKFFFAKVSIFNDTCNTYYVNKQKSIFQFLFFIFINICFNLNFATTNVPLIKLFYMQIYSTCGKDIFHIIEFYLNACM